MANKIVQIMQYNGSGNDTLIPLTAQQADNATNATNAGTAVIGQYASSDTSKGTIEQRLSFLESSESSMSITSGISATILDNKVIRSGSLCSFKLRLTNVSGVSVQLAYNQIIGTLPINYRPSANWEGYGMMRLGNNYESIFILINTDGQIKISSSAVGSPNQIYFSIGYSVV